MAFPASGLFVASMVAKFNATQLAINLVLTTHKMALWTNTGTYDLTADTAYGVAPWNANEITGTGYTAGGNTIPGTAWAHVATGNIAWTASAVQWTTATFSNVQGCLNYADALAGDNGICAVNFGGLFSVTAGTFTVTPAAGGIFAWDVIP